MQNSVQQRYEQTEIGKTVTLTPEGHSNTAMRLFQGDVEHVRALESTGLVEAFGAHPSSDHGIGWLDQISFKRLR